MVLADRFNILAALGFPTDSDAAIELTDKNGLRYSIVADVTSTGLLIEGGKLTVASGGIVVTAGGFTVTAGGFTITAGVLSQDDATDTSSTVTGSIHTDGGVGIAKALWVGTTSRLVGNVTVDGLLISDNSTDATTITNGAIQTDGGLGVVKKAFIGTGLTVDTGGIALKAGRMSEVLTVVDDDSQNMTLAAADILAGINIHSSTSAGGTVTTDTGANIISGIPLTHDGQAVVSYYINDGDQTVTFAAGASGITVSDVGNTVLINESCTLLWVRTDATNVVLHIIH